MRKYLALLAFLLLFLTGCNMEVPMDKMCATQLVFLSSSGEIRPYETSFYETSLFAPETRARYIDLYDWDKFNADHGPFVDLYNDSAQKTDGTWILLPYATMFETYTRPESVQFTNYGIAPISPKRPHQITDEVLAKHTGKVLLFWYSDTALNPTTGITDGTLQAIVASPSYKNPYVLPETEILYSSIDLSDCKTADEKLRKLFEECSGETYALEASQWTGLLLRTPYDFTDEFTPTPRETKKVRDIVTELPETQPGNRAILYSSGRVQHDGFYAPTEDWPDVVRLFRASEALIGIEADGTVNTVFQNENRIQVSEFQLEYQAQYQSWIQGQKDIKEIVTDRISTVVLHNDGSLEFWNYAPFTVSPDKQLDYTDVEVLLFAYGRLSTSAYVLRCKDGRTVLVQDIRQLDNPGFQNAITVYDKHGVPEQIFTPTPEQELPEQLPEEPPEVTTAPTSNIAVQGNRFNLTKQGKVTPHSHIEHYCCDPDWNAIMETYDWEAFNEVHGPFVDLKDNGYGEFVKTEDGEWILLPCYDPFEQYTEKGPGPNGPEGLYRLQNRPEQLTDEVLQRSPVKSVFYWISDPEYTDLNTTEAGDTVTYITGGTLEAIVLNPSYQSDFLLTEPEILYCSMDLSDCTTMDEKIRKIFEDCPGMEFQTTGDGWQNLWQNPDGWNYDFTTPYPVYE